MPSDLYRYAIIGTGRPHGTEGATGFGMAHAHYPHFKKTGRVDLVAIADIRDDNAELFLKKYDSKAKHYRDYHTMLKEEKPQLLSICTWPHLHAEMTIAAAEAGVKAILCEKPMATTWGDAKRMKAAADANGTLLSFNHQRRNNRFFQAVRQAVVDREIGDLVMIEIQVGDLFDWGTHWLDMSFYYNGDVPAEWVIAQIDSRNEKRVFGAFEEEQSVVSWKWTNGVRGILVSGFESSIGAVHRLIGTEGVIEVLSERQMRLSTKTDPAWRVVEVPQGEQGEHALTSLDIVRQLDEPGYKSFLSADNAIQHTEVIYAAYESSRWRGRIDLPLKPEDSALLDMLEKGQIGPNRK